MRASSAWKTRFALSVARYRSAQREVEEAAAREPPAVDTYIEARRELDGTGLMLDLAELLGAFKIPVLPPSGGALLEDLRRATKVVARALVDVLQEALLPPSQPTQPA